MQKPAIHSVPDPSEVPTAPTRRSGRAAVVILLVLVVAAGAAYWRFADDLAPLVARLLPPSGTTTAPPASAGAPRAVPVEMSPVKSATLDDEISAVGTLRSNESVVIRPEVAGRVAQIHFAEGEAVAAGARLVTLDSSIDQAELRQAEANLELSRRNFERAKELFQKGAGTARARDEAVAKLKVDEAQAALARARLEKTILTAPFAGIAGLRKVSVGDYVSPGQDIVNVESIDPVKVDFRVPEVHLAAVAEGQTIRVTLDAFPGKTFDGVVFAIDPRVDDEGRSVAIRARIPNADASLRPGLFARVRLVVARRTDAIVVPEQAIVPRGDDQFVFRVVDGKASLTKVRLGQRRAAEVEVVEGLSPGDVIVTAGQVKIRDGMPVRQAGAGKAS